MPIKEIKGYILFWVINTKTTYKRISERSIDNFEDKIKDPNKKNTSIRIRDKIILFE